MSDNDEDREERTVLGFVIALAVVVAIAVSLLAGLGATGMFADKKAVVVSLPAATAPAASVTPSAAASPVVVGPVELFFDTGKSEAPATADATLAPIIEAVKSKKADKAVISGFHDPTGDAAINAELSKQRAIDVARVLTQAGLTPDQIELRKPQDTTGDGKNREARRVEVTAEKN